MAVYKLFPEKDTFISTKEPAANAGKDEILEIAGYPDISNTPQTHRTLIQFSDSEIDDIVDNKIGSTNFSSSIKLYLARASELPTSYTLYAYPIFITGSTEWDNGTGKYGDSPIDKTGVSWTYISQDETNAWPTGSFATGTTASFRATGRQGGGNWYTGSNGESMEFQQSHSISSDHDLEINVTAAVKQIYNDTLDNKGFILKLEDTYEFSATSSIYLSYFGVDTNTIYPPCLEFKWDDCSYSTGSLTVLTSSISNIEITNNRGRYTDEGTRRFRLLARPTYPSRTFVTSSVYLTNYALPTASYWGLRDENTEEMVIDFDTSFTKVSCDSTGPYFDVYMDGLEPERYYRLLVKTELDGSTTVIDNQNIFKVVRNG